MARGTPTHEPPDYSDDEPRFEEPAPDARQLLRMFLPVAAAGIVVVLAVLLALKFLVIPAMERTDPAVQERALATIGALQTQEVVSRAQQAATPQPTPQLSSTPRLPQAAQPVAQATVGPTSVAVAAPAQTTPAQTLVATPAIAGTAAPAQQGETTPPQLSIDTGDVPDDENAQGELGGPLTVPTIDPVAQGEVQEAYSRYWTQRALAFRDLDPGLLVDVAGAGELASLTNGIDQLRVEGRAVQTHVIHHVIALPTAPGEAVVQDEYEDRSIYIDPQTREPIDPTNPDPQTGPVVKVRKVLQKLDGVWKVTASVRYD